MPRSFARPVLLASTALLALVALSACTPSTASPTVSPSETASATPATTEPPAAASIGISAEAITVFDAEGAPLVSYDYFQPTDEVVAGLTEVLGAAVETPDDGGLETPPGIVHEWDGLRLYDSETPGTVPDIPNHWVFVDAPTAGGLPIGTDPGIGSATGVKVSDQLSTATIGVTSGAPYIEPSTGVNTIVSQLGQVAIPPNPAASGDRHFFVIVLSNADTGEVTRLIAPSGDFGV
ncbi:hypothetical protein ACFVTX_11405 [Agromyces sp. NPDC058136]|uniref:hypothetical protein n=1 Tax=Agromyces sp. NPDC058136 TaxID=3346354 RepID=UPI0036DB1334